MMSGPIGRNADEVCGWQSRGFQVDAALAIAMALMGGIYLAVRWSAQQSDAVAVKRQQQLVELVISKMQGSIAHDQESVTVWMTPSEKCRRSGIGGGSIPTWAAG